MPKKFFISVSTFIVTLGLVIRFVKSATLQCLPCDQKVKSASFEEYEFEHQVTRQEAVNALNLLNSTFFEAPRESACKAISCTQKTMKYCLGPQFLNDHCWCEQSHAEEGLPFVPHTCYVGDKQYRASIGSCIFFSEVKRCCCLQALAKRWKHLSSSTKMKSKHFSIWLPLIPIFVLGRF